MFLYQDLYIVIVDLFWEKVFFSLKKGIEKYKKMGEFVKYVSNTKPKEFKRD